MKLRGAASNIRPLWLRSEMGGNGTGLDVDEQEEGGEEEGGATPPDRQLVHESGRPSVVGGGVD